MLDLNWNALVGASGAGTSRLVKGCIWVQISRGITRRMGGVGMREFSYAIAVGVTK